jgi:Concanavalin A-like lectin/glucanases superfamily
MLLLTSPSSFLELQTLLGVSTDWTCSWVDVNFALSSFVPGSAQGNVAATGSTPIAPAPAAGLQRQIKYISVVNRDLALTQTVTIDKNSGAQVNVTGGIPLAPGDSLQYVDSRGFFVLTAQGFEKFIGATGVAGAPGATGPGGFGPPGADGDNGEDGMPIPGAPGAAGTPGAQGPFGYLMLLDGDQGEEALPIPGPQGIQGPQGIPGTGGGGSTSSGFEILYQEIVAEEQWPQGVNTPPPSAAAVSLAVPATIPDLVYWLDGAAIAARVSSGAKVPRMPNFFPFWNADYFYRVGSQDALISGTLNSLGVLTFAGGERYIASEATAAFAVAGGFLLANCTIFVVFNGTAFRSSANGYSFITGANGAGGLEFRLAQTGALSLNDASSTATGTSALSNATWYQVNATYNSSTSAYAFRAVRAVAGSGTQVLSISKASNGLLFFNVSNSFNLDFVGSVAEMIIYNRVLSGAEITAVETYLNGKWGV